MNYERSRSAPPGDLVVFDRLKNFTLPNIANLLSNETYYNFFPTFNKPLLLTILVFQLSLNAVSRNDWICIARI